jgi:hypothetical protein
VNQSRVKRKAPNKQEYPGLPATESGPRGVAGKGGVSSEGPTVKRSKKSRGIKQERPVEENPFQLKAVSRGARKKKKKEVTEEQGIPDADFFEHEFPGLSQPAKKVETVRKGFILGDPNQKDELEEMYGIVISKKGPKKKYR